jgi:hypothetical protein
MKEFTIKFESAGFVLFDPFNLDKFCIENSIKGKNLMDNFIKNEIIGDMAVTNGKIFPIYTIEPDDYKIIISDEISIKDNIKFIHKNFPLEITNEKLVVADIYSIINWEPDFYKHLKNDFPTQFIMDYENGNYSIDVIGYYYDKKNYGYNFVLNKTEILPELDTTKDIDTYDFNLCGFNSPPLCGVILGVWGMCSPTSTYAKMEI